MCWNPSGPLLLTKMFCCPCMPSLPVPYISCMHQLFVRCRAPALSCLLFESNASTVCGFSPFICNTSLPVFARFCVHNTSWLLAPWGRAKEQHTGLPKLQLFALLSSCRYWCKKEVELYAGEWSIVSAGSYGTMSNEPNACASNRITMSWSPSRRAKCLESPVVGVWFVVEESYGSRYQSGSLFYVQ